MDYGKETVVLFEIDQPICSRVYGEGSPPSRGDAADFDGTNDYMTTGAGLTGAADSKLFTFSAWVRLDGSNGSTLTVLEGNVLSAGGSFRLAIERDSSGRFQFRAKNSADTNVLNVLSSASYNAGATWLNVLASFDLTNTAKRHIYINDVSDLSTVVTYTNDTIDFTLGGWAIGGASDGTLKMDGCLRDVYFAAGAYIDFSVEANRRKFFSASGLPANLGTDGSLPTGTAAIVYQHIDEGEAVANFATNRGTGGNFTIHGTLTVADTNPSVLPGCQADLGVDGTRKCYNTRFTCQDPDNYLPAAEPLTLRFALNQQEATLQYGPLIPSMAEPPDTTPGAINLAGMNRNTSALGSRETIAVKFDDHQYSDHLVDPYRLDRITGAAQADAIGYDPTERGTFWGKFLARNPYYSSYRCRVYEGYLGDAVSDMRSRTYLIDRIEGPANGQVSIVAKDLFSIIEQQKAVAPVASQGELSANISAVAGSATLNPAGIGALEYPAAGHVVIGDEAIAFTRVGDVLTFTQRGALGTTADTHDDDDLVQLVLTYTSELAVDIVYDLLLNYASLTTADLPKADWDIALAELTKLYSTHIATPTPVADLIGELAEQAGFTIWPDVETGQIQVAALRPTAPTATVNDDAWIVDGSYNQNRQDDRRVSQVWIYYGQINPVVAVDEPKNYHSREVIADLDAEGEFEFGVSAIREIFSRWIPQFGRTFAQETGERVLAMFLIPPLEATFKLHASRDGELQLTRLFNLEAFESQDDTGSILSMTMAAVEIERGENELEIRAQQVMFATPDAGAGERVIFIENDVYNINLRTIHDSLYAVPDGTETVRFIVSAGVTVGSTSTGSYAMSTGSWPGGMTLLLDNGGRIQARGGNGATYPYPNPPPAGAVGGDALQATAAITIDNASGQIWGGGGGGGANAGIGGSGGAGTDPGTAGTGFLNGSPGTTEAGGAATTDPAGNGGAGGGPGLNGSAATGPQASAGGTAGRYIVGNAFVTWAANGDRRGGVA